MKIHTIGGDVDASIEWPDEFYLQGGRDGIVFSRKDNTSYRTAFVEIISSSIFIRGEGATIVEAEQKAYKKYQTQQSCSGHEYVTRGYTNGAGFCKHCGKFKSGVFTAEELGQYCIVCGKPSLDQEEDIQTGVLKFYCSSDLTKKYNKDFEYLSQLLTQRKLTPKERTQYIKCCMILDVDWDDKFYE